MKAALTKTGLKWQYCSMKLWPTQPANGSSESGLIPHLPARRSFLQQGSKAACCIVLARADIVAALAVPYTEMLTAQQLDPVMSCAVGGCPQTVRVIPTQSRHTPDVCVALGTHTSATCLRYPGSSCVQRSMSSLEGDSVLHGADVQAGGAHLRAQREEDVPLEATDPDLLIAGAQSRARLITAASLVDVSPLCSFLPWFCCHLSAAVHDLRRGSVSLIHARLCAVCRDGA